MNKKKPIADLRAMLAEEIREARRQSGLSQEGLALAADVDRTYVSQVERAVANPTLEILERLAGALNAELVVSFTPKQPSALTHKKSRTVAKD